MPRKPWPIWAAAWALLLSFIPINLFYWDQAIRAGLSEAEAATAAIMMFGGMVVPIFMMPVAFFATYLSVQRYDPRGGLLVWRGDRPIRSIVLTLVLGLPAAILAVLMIHHVGTGPAWYDWLWVGWGLLCILWLLWLRAAAINQHPEEGPEADVFS